MKKRTNEGNTLTQLILEIFQINGELLAAGNKITKPFGLTSARWQIMGAIDLAEQPLTVAQIARRMGLTRQGVQRIVNDLKQLDMVELLDNRDHKRAPLIAITSAGEIVMAKIDQAQINWVNQLSCNLNEQTIHQALNLLEKVRGRLEQNNE